ncbi:lectin-like protein, partial [Treponema sp. R80B11-R83G3]
YYLQAVNYNPSSAEIVSRLDIVNADITSSSMGKDIRNAIAWRKAWVERLTECDQFVVGYVKNTPLTMTLIYSADFKQGEIDWDKETIPISIDACLAPLESWPVPITGVVNAVYEGFAGTGQAETWKLDWPLKNASGGASQVTPVKEVKYNLVLDLLNDKGAVLGRQGVTFSSGWKIEFRDGKSVGVKIQTPQTVTYPAVDANKISETLAIRVASINGRIVNAGSADSVAVKAMTGYDYKKNTLPKRGTLYSGNGHAYEVINQTMSWTDAKLYCEKLEGHLATITSAGEQKFIENLLSGEGNNKNMYWLGGYTTGGFKYQWVTGEPFVYANWNQRGNATLTQRHEDKMQIYRVPHPSYGQFGNWEDDTNEGQESFFKNTGFICEWE